MTDQHPLTDEICLDLLLSTFDQNNGGLLMDMRAAADWQLEQVIEWLATNLDFACYLTSDGYASDGRDQKDVYVVIQDLKKAMRPTTTQENN